MPYPRDPAALSDEQWAQYLFFRDNPKGLFHERWVHGVGCRRWFTLKRDTVSYEIAPDTEAGPDGGTLDDGAATAAAGHGQDGR